MDPISSRRNLVLVSFAMLWEQINSFVIWLLIAAALISGLIGWNEFRHSGETTEFIETGAILAIVIMNAALGIIQEKRAEEALAAWKKLAAPDAHVIRDGHRTTVPARSLVPGDIVFLEAGNLVPADLHLLEAVNLHIEEASLTGKSLAVQKNAASVMEKNVPLGDEKIPPSWVPLSLMGAVVVLSPAQACTPSLVSSLKCSSLSMKRRLLCSVASTNWAEFSPSVPCSWWRLCLLSH